MVVPNKDEQKVWKILSELPYRPIGCETLGKEDNPATSIITTEEAVLNKDYKGLQVARIEFSLKNEEYPRELDRLEVWDDSRLFCQERDN